MAGRDDLQGAADKLVASGVFAHVKYNFQSRADGLVVTFHVDEAERIPAYFDNFPWFTDGELNDAIRAKISFYNGTLPGAGSVVEEAPTVVSEFLADARIAGGGRTSADRQSQRRRKCSGISHRRRLAVDFDIWNSAIQSLNNSNDDPATVLRS